MKITGRKYPDRSVVSCKDKSINWIAAGSRLHMDFPPVFLIFVHVLVGSRIV